MDFEREVFAEVRMGDGKWGPQEILVFCVVAVMVVGLLQVGVLLAGLGWM